MMLFTAFATIPIADNETILDALLRHGVAVDYQCKEGYCGSCRLKVCGEVRYVRKPLATKQSGEVLICCAVACGDLYLF